MYKSVKERLIEFLAYKNLGQKTFAEKVGVSSGFVNAIRVSIQPKTLEKISEAFPELNIPWLLTGEGEMLNSSMPASGADKSGKVPLINLDAKGGFGSNLENGEGFIERYMPWENSRAGDFAIMLSGTSMSPNIAPGSYLLLRKVEGWREFLEFNILYVLELKDERRLLKLVQKSDDPDCFSLVSYNPQNPPQDIERSYVEKVYKVISVKTNYGF